MAVVNSHLEAFHQEAEDLLGKIESVILLIEENPQDGEAVNNLFRAVHTLKGTGSMFGLTDLANFSHSLESVLDKVRSRKLPASREVIDLVLAYRDQVALMLQATDGGPGADPARVEEIVRRLAALSPSSAGADVPAPPARTSRTVGEGRPITFLIRLVSQPTFFATGVDPARVLDELRELGESFVVAHLDAVPPLDGADPETCYLAWDIFLTTSAGINAIRDVLFFIEDISKVVIEDISSEVVLDPDTQRPRLGEILLRRGDVTRGDLEQALSSQVKIGERLVEDGRVSSSKVASALNEQQSVAKQKDAAKNDSIRVPANKLDALINLLGELVINQARLSEIARTSGNAVLAGPVEEGARLTDELRDIVLNIRMMPIGTTFSRFKQLVRDLSGELGKQIELVTEGAETELDKTVIDRLGDPLVHLIRNCIDHGIEPPDIRAAAGKPAKGTIKLIAEQLGARVVISIIDDGRGLDPAKLVQKAKEKGLVPADADLCDKDAYALIFLPGFSTAPKVTEVSGRGVGMDVVRREIEALRGAIEVHSELGRGTRIELSLPLTLAIIEGLLVNVATESFVIPLSAVEECLELTPETVAISPKRNLIQIRGVPVPLVRLRDSFELAGMRAPLEQAVVVTLGDFRVGVVVDQIMGTHQTVIRSLGSVYKKADCVCGATILGDGRVAMILDLAGLVRNAQAQETMAIRQNTASLAGHGHLLSA